MEKSIFQIPIKTLKRYSFYKKSQYWSKEKLQNYQDEMLIKLVQHAGKYVPYYRKLFKEIVLDLTSFQGRKDLHKIPLLDKETVRTRKGEFIADNAKKYGITWDSTSGTTGTPLHFVLDNSVQANKIAALLRSYKWAGYSIGKKTFSIQSYYFKNNDFHYNKFYNILRFDSNRLKKESALKVINEIKRFQPRFFMGFPFDILMLSKFADEEGIKIHSPQSIVTYGETLSKNKRGLLEKAYNCKVYNFFSLHECAAMISECEQGNLHLIEDFAFHEIVDECGNDTSEKGFGELVGTSLYNYSMPLIRYKISDIVQIEKPIKACKCKRNFRIVKEISGKQCDFIQTPDGRFLGSVMSHSIDNAKGVVCSQLIQNSLEHIVVNLVVDDSFNKKSQIELEKGLRKRLGNQIKLEFHQVSQLEKKKSGKTPFIISRIGNEYS
ncbi:MAG TPA: phenylacetate--CoA ligase family protein [Candidatus Cloacimonetes bacterium]|nr:phenylacetate--CoA ligase family protein [Candidatus Cloacimonadota bacterium]